MADEIQTCGKACARTSTVDPATETAVREAGPATPVTTVPLLDLKIQYAAIKDEIGEAIDRVLTSQQFILGPEVQALEEEIAEYCNCRYAVGVSSGTDALLVSLMALGISAGDEVVTTPFTFFATAGSVLRVGAVPVFADIDPVTFNIDPTEVEKVITPRTRAIMPVHLFGQCADMDPLLAIAARHNLLVIEDAAQAIGSEYQGQRAGSMGTVNSFSFFPSKNLGAYGEGGIITTNDRDLAEKIRIIRNQGANPKYHHKVVGGNFRLDALQAAVLRVKLNRLDGWTEKRRSNAAFYSAKLREAGLVGEKLTAPAIIHERHVFNQYVIRAQRRDDLRQFLQDRGVSTEIYYPKCLHLQECFPDGRYKEGDLPLSEAASAEVLALPIYPELTAEQKSYVVNVIAEFYGT
jgi:dTDP-4-amino-4,6-dideoxygalactose transaminase